MDNQQFRQLLQHLNLSWTGYRKVRKGVKKRIRRHMQELGCGNVSDYLRELDKNHEARHECNRLMTVSISRFFRDKGLWDTLQKEILPGLIEAHKEKIVIWSAGCASGEEVYSLKILWDSLGKSMSCLPEMEITATDINPSYLERAKDGVYPSSSLREVPEELRSKYFQSKRGGKRYIVQDVLRGGIMWKVHNLISDPLESQFHIILLRNNLLTYYEDEDQKCALKNVVANLWPGGFLILGSHEKLPYEINELQYYGSLTCIFKKMGY